MLSAAAVYDKYMVYYVLYSRIGPVILVPALDLLLFANDIELIL